MASPQLAYLQNMNSLRDCDDDNNNNNNNLDDDNSV